MSNEITTIKKEDGLVYTYLDGKPICGAKKRNKDEICKKSPSVGRNRCKLHGGASPRGTLSKKFKDGRYSRDMPTRLATRYAEALKDPELLSLRDEIAMMQARISEQLTRLDQGESGALWKLLRNKYEEATGAVRASDQASFTQIFAEIGRIINRGHNDFRSWEELSRNSDQLRKLTESENKRLLATQQMMTAEQAMMMLAFVVSVIRKHVHEKEKLAAISAEISEYMSRTAADRSQKYKEN